MPPADPVPRGAAIRARLRAVADPAGFLPFDRFVEIALSTPGAGYYATLSTLGVGGDFYTAAHVHPVFAEAIAARIWREHVRLGRPRQFRVVEAGPGDGTLALGVLTALARELEGADPFEYVLVESSPRLRERLSERFAGSPFAQQVRFAESIGADGPFRGVVLANELLDALPFRRLIARGGTWRELGVRVADAGVEWAEAPLAPVPSPTLPPAPSEGTILEINAAAEAIVREIGDHLEAGVALLLDYGSEEGELIAGHPHGTLAAVREHRAVDDPLDAPGTADLSAFVNFTRIRAAAATAGLRETAYGPQAEALGRWGIEALAAKADAGAGSAEAEVKTRLAVKNLLFGFGNFRVLELSAGLT